MPGLPSISVETLLWGAAALVAVWVAVPLLFMAVGFTRLRSRILGGPETLQPTGDDPQYADLFERLRGLGFEPLGSRREVGWFCNRYWYRVYPPGRVFGTPAGDCFVSLYRIFAGQPWRLSFHTVFADGSLVSTANQMPHFRIDLPGYHRWGCVTPDLTELLRLHRETADHYGAGRAVASLDLRGLCETTARHSERYVRSQGPAHGATGLATPLLLVGLWAILGGTFGFDHWEAPVAFVLAGVLYQVLHRDGVRKAARASWDEDRTRALAEQWRRSRQAPRRPD